MVHLDVCPIRKIPLGEYYIHHYQAERMYMVINIIRSSRYGQSLLVRRPIIIFSAIILETNING